MKDKVSELFKIFLMGTIALLAILFSSDPLTSHNILFNGEWQHFDYLKVVGQLPKITSDAPYCWRLLVPFLVYISPFPVETSFFINTFLSLLVCSLLVYYIVKELGFDKVYCWIAFFTFLSMINVVRINLIEFIAVDATAFMFMLLSIYFTQKENKLLFIVSTILGVLTKEITLIVIPFYFFYHAEKNIFDRKNISLLKKNIIWGLPAVFALLILRLLVTPAHNYNYFSLLHDFVNYRISTFSGIRQTLNKQLIHNQTQLETAAINIYRITIGAIGPILFFIMIKIKKLKDPIKSFFPILFFSFVQIFIASDHERLIASGFIVYILLFIYSVQSFETVNSINAKWFLAFTVLLFLSQLIMKNNIFQETYYSTLVQLVLGALFLVILYIVKVLRLFRYKRKISQGVIEE
jgi:hypothetical protein